MRTLTLQIYPDIHPDSPREWDNTATMACWHGRYTLGDERPASDPHTYMMELACPDLEEELDEIWVRRYGDKPWDDKEQREWTEYVKAAIEKRFDEKFYSLPLYLYDHGGITMSTSSFSCQWDSGQVGFIYIAKDGNAVEDWEQAKRTMQSEVETYDQYLRGEVHGFVLLDEEGNELDACWGFYGSDYKTNGMADYVDLDKVKLVQYMEEQSHTTMGVRDEYELG